MNNNPLIAHVVCSNAKQSDYIKQEKKRGDHDCIVSRSDLCMILSNPHKWLNGWESADTSASTWGTVVDFMLMNDGKSEPPFVVTPETYTNEKGIEKPWNRNATVCREFEDRHEGMLLISHATYEAAQTAVYRIRDDAYLKPLFNGAAFQMWIEGAYKTKCGAVVLLKSLIDIVPSKTGDCLNWLADLKTTTDASTGVWPRKLFDMEYHIQAALYLDMYNAATGEERNTFAHVIQERDAPYEIGRRILDETFIEIGRAKYVEALNILGECYKTGAWPGYDDIGIGSTIRGFTVSSPKAWMVGI